MQAILDAEHRLGRRAAYRYGRDLGLSRRVIRATIRAAGRNRLDWSDVRRALGMTAIGW